MLRRHNPKQAASAVFGLRLDADALSPRDISSFQSILAAVGCWYGGSQAPNVARSVSLFKNHGRLGNDAAVSSG